MRMLCIKKIKSSSTTSEWNKRKEMCNQWFDCGAICCFKTQHFLQRSMSNIIKKKGSVWEVVMMVWCLEYNNKQQLYLLQTYFLSTTNIFCSPYAKSDATGKKGEILWRFYIFLRKNHHEKILWDRGKPTCCENNNNNLYVSLVVVTEMLHVNCSFLQRTQADISEKAIRRLLPPSLFR